MVKIEKGTGKGNEENMKKGKGKSKKNGRKEEGEEEIVMEK